MSDDKFEETTEQAVSRRHFLKIAGITGATLGAGAGLGGLVAACGTSSTSTTAGATTSTAGVTTSTAGTSATAGSTTTAGAGSSASTSAESGRDVKIGLVNALTGSLAPFADSDNYILSRWKEYAANGVVLGDGASHKFDFIVADSQSDSNRASQVAADLINNSAVDIILVSSSPDTVVPVAVQCEALGTPMLSNFCPWQPFYYRGSSVPASGYKWTYLHGIGLEQLQDVYLDMWSKLPTNKIVGVLFPNDSDGNAWRTGWEPVWAAKGLKMIDGGSFQDGTEDYTSQISKFKSAGAEIAMGVLIPPDFTNFWRQAHQQGYRPKFLTIGKALLFQSSVQAAGSIAYNATCEAAWHPSWPHKSSLTGETAQQIANDFETKTGKQWVQPLGQYAKFEWAVNVLKRVSNLDDKNGIATAITQTKMDTLLGPIDFTAPVKAGTNHPVPNVYRVPLGGGQWVKGTKYFTDFAIVSNVDAPGLPITAKVLPM